MERLNLLVILMGLVAGTPSVSRSAPDDASLPAPAEAPARAAESPAPPADRPEPPVAPQVYLKTGALLFNKQRYDLASTYFEAARMYRDRLTGPQQIVLDEYRDQLRQYLREQEQAKAAPAVEAAVERATDPGVTTASTAGIPALELSGAPAEVSPGGPAPAPAGPEIAPPATLTPTGAPEVSQPSAISTEALRGTADAKQHARWLLQQAREQIHKRQFDAAERIVTEVRGMGVKWGFFDDTPDKVTATIEKVRARPGLPEAGEVSNLPRDRRTARARLREARAALAAREIDKADAIAQEVRTWGVRYGLFDDTPEKVSAAVDEARRRTAVHNTELMVRSYVGADTATRGEPNVPTAPSPGTPGPR